MKSTICLWLIALCFAGATHAESVRVSCGESTGYSYYFPGGLVSLDQSGFSEDGITDGQFTLTMSSDGDGDVLAKDATGMINSASSQGGKVLISPSSDKGINWVLFYSDGTIENYALNLDSMRVAVWRNTVGNEKVAKNSLMVSECQRQ